MKINQFWKSKSLTKNEGKADKKIIGDSIIKSLNGQEILGVHSSKLKLNLEQQPLISLIMSNQVFVKKPEILIIHSSTNDHGDFNTKKHSKTSQYDQKKS